MGRQNQKPFLCFLVVLLGVALHIFVGLAWTPSAFAQSSREQALELAKEALVLEKQLSADSLQLRLLEPAEWPDASLGCPVTGRIYAQVTTSGYRVVLSAGASVFRVHVGGGSAVICGERLSVAQPRSSFAEEPELPIAEPTEPALKRLVTQARQDLAERLGIEAEDIELLELQELVWPDTSLGCSRPGMEYLQVLRDGALLRLRVGKRAYAYHSGGGRSPFLCESPRKTKPL